VFFAVYSFLYKDVKLKDIVDYLKIKKVYMFNLANLFTAFNLIAGISSILFAILGYLDFAVFAIFAGAIFDFLDGFIARAMKTMGELGKQLDSLADMITFGVAPGILMMVILSIDIETYTHFSVEGIRTNFFQWIDAFMNGEFNFLPLFALLIPFFSLFRLAKFNLDTRQTSSFIGFPTPANTLFYTTFPLVLVFKAEDITFYTYFFHPITLCGLIVVLSLMMVSEIPLFSLKVKSFKLKGNEIRFTFLLISLIFILVFNVWAIALIVLLYLILSIVENTFFNTDSNEI